MTTAKTDTIPPDKEDRPSTTVLSPEPPLAIMDFLDLRALQELQDGFSAVTRLRTTVCDDKGSPLTVASEDSMAGVRVEAIAEAVVQATTNDDGVFSAPITVAGQTLGRVVIESGSVPGKPLADLDHLVELFKSLGAPKQNIEAMIVAAEKALAPHKTAAVQSALVLAAHISRLCQQGHELRERIEELGTINRLSTLLAGHSDLQHRLDAAVRSVVAVMNLKAACIRLIDDDQRLLKVAAVFNLSDEYVLRGSIPLDKSSIARTALSGEVVFVESLKTDARVVSPAVAAKEGLASTLVAGMSYRGRPIGTLQVYTEAPRAFSSFEVNLLQAIAQLTASAVENFRLDEQRKESERVQRQVHLARDVQLRMIPNSMPTVKPFDISARYVPCFELGGDFYDFIELGTHLGVVVGDVAGKGIAASLLMASVRSSLRAFAQDVFDMNEVVSRVNIALIRDTLPQEFVTLFYGVLDPQTLRFTYCNAGHEPPLMLRNGRIYKLDVGGMVLGIDGDQKYEHGVVQLKPHDSLLIFTDGLPDAQNFNDQRFGRERILPSLRECEHMSAQESVSHLLWNMRRFVGLNKPIDDTTIVMIKVNEPDHAPQVV